MATYFINETLVPRARDENVLLVHPHAQRTGGKTIRNAVFSHVFGSERVYSHASRPDAKRWRSLTDAELRGYRAYADLDNYADIGLSRPCLFIGVLRDPVYRAVSLYHFVRQHDGHRHQALAMRTSLENFYRIASRRDPSYFRNLQCRRICGRADARLAVKCIQAHYIGVGFTEHMKDFVEALRGVFGWPEIELRSKTRSHYETEITPEFCRMVGADNSEDCELFEVMSGGPPYRCADRSLSRRVRSWGMRTRDFTLTVARRLV